ncbi:MAG: hypothetical protein U1D30_25225 [Planctomycetota bacterium]
MEVAQSQSRMVPRTTGLSALLFFGLWSVYGLVFQDRDWGTTGRLLMTYALVRRDKSDPFVASGGRLLEHPQTRDLAVNDEGRFFCDKAPGQSWLSTPAYWLSLKWGWPNPFLTPRWRLSNGPVTIG